MKINVHAGHNPDGKVACGAVGLIKESTEARKVKEEVIRLLKTEGQTVFDCTVENGSSQSDILGKIVQKCNANTVDLDVSIHFNAGANKASSNGNTTGTEIYIYSDTSKSKAYAQQTVEKISKLGFRNRGVKIQNSLYVLRNTKAPSMLIECCFVDDADDVKLYNYKYMAKAIAEGILNKTITETKETETSNATIYKVQVGAYSKKENAEQLVKELKKDGYDSFITK